MGEWNLDSPPPRNARRESGCVSPELPVTPAAPPTPEPPGASATGKTRSKRRSWLWVGAAGLALLVAGALAGFYLARSESADEAAELVETRVELAQLTAAHAQSEQRNWDYYRRLQGLEAENGALAAGPEHPLPSDEGTTSTTTSGSPALGAAYGDGVYLVGEDISPGTYDGVVTGDLGYWARLRGTDGSVGAIAENAIVRGPFVLTITEVDTAVELWGVELNPR
jgi:hypothetical protein